MTDAFPVTSHTVDVDGAALHVEERGDGPAVLLVHSGLVSSAMWDALLPHLGGCRLITPDSRGHGRSTNPGGGLSYPRLADDVVALVESLELTRPIVGGYSDGGQVALELGARHPGVAGGLIVGAAHPDASQLREANRAFLGADATNTPDLAHVDATLGEFADLAKSMHPGGESHWQALVRDTASMWLDYPGLSPDVVASIPGPTLVFTGDRDDLVPTDLSVSLYRAMRDAELAVCPLTDHFTAITPDRAGLFAAIVLDFVRRHADLR